ncbi:MAG TPA: divalent metal cation transporter, partial [Syntrophorhabdaceae bacterium]|nr:divalent metal cation transporter [Syntrophorhabdaceae bacterium]
VTTYYICEAMGWEAGVGKNFKEAPQFNFLFTSILAITVAIVLIPNLPLIKVMWFSQIINCLLLPVILIYILQLINNKELMGEYRNSTWVNVVSYISTLILIVLSLMLFYTSIIDLTR